MVKFLMHCLWGAKMLLLLVQGHRCLAGTIVVTTEVYSAGSIGQEAVELMDDLSQKASVCSQIAAV
jgi:hypothetical protein